MIFAKLIGKCGFREIGEVPFGHIMPFDENKQRFVLTFETKNIKLPICTVSYYYDDILNGNNWEIYKNGIKIK